MIIKYKTKQQAEQAAADLGRYETDGWQFRVQQDGSMYVVAVYDETGDFIAYWGVA